MAYLQVPAQLGPVLGPLLGGFITTYLHWRWIFFVNVPLGILGFFLVTRYFDTKDNALHNASATLRLRDGDAGSEQTFKSGTGRGGVRRGEWNAPVTGVVPDPQAFAPQPRKLLEQLLDGRELRPLAVTRVERTTRRLRFGASTIEAGTCDISTTFGVISLKTCMCASVSGPPSTADAGTRWPL